MYLADTNRQFVAVRNVVEGYKYDKNKKIFEQDSNAWSDHNSETGSEDAGLLRNKGVYDASSAPMDSNKLAIGG